MSDFRRDESEDERVRFGREPAGLEETRYLEEQVPGADEHEIRRARARRIGVPLVLTVAEYERDHAHEDEAA